MKTVISYDIARQLCKPFLKFLIIFLIPQWTFFAAAKIRWQVNACLFIRWKQCVFAVQGRNFFMLAFFVTKIYTNVFCLWAVTFKQSLQVGPTNKHTLDQETPSHQGSLVVMWCAVWFSCPHTHEDVSLRPHWYMLESKHPAPILSMFEVSQIMAKVATMGRRIIRHTQNWEQNVMSFRDLIHI